MEKCCINLWPIFFENEERLKNRVRRTKEENLQFGIKPAQKYDFQVEGKVCARIYYYEYLKPECKSLTLQLNSFSA